MEDVSVKECVVLELTVVVDTVVLVLVDTVVVVVTVELLE